MSETNLSIKYIYQVAKRKSIGLRVCSKDTVKVSFPIGYKAQAEAFVSKKQSWIAKKIIEIRNRENIVDDFNKLMLGIQNKPDFEPKINHILERLAFWKKQIGQKYQEADVDVLAGLAFTTSYWGICQTRKKRFATKKTGEQNLISVSGQKILNSIKSLFSEIIFQSKPKKAKTKTEEARDKYKTKNISKNTLKSAPKKVLTGMPKKTHTTHPRPEFFYGRDVQSCDQIIQGSNQRLVPNINLNPNLNLTSRQNLNQTYIQKHTSPKTQSLFDFSGVEGINNSFEHDSPNYSQSTQKVVSKSIQKAIQKTKPTAKILINVAMVFLVENTKVLDYLCIHELCHLRVSGHGQKFWSMVAEYCPEYKDLRKDLKKQSHLLEKKNMSQLKTFFAKNWSRDYFNVQI